VTLTLNIANASAAGHIDTLSLTGGDVNKVTIVAAGVEKTSSTTPVTRKAGSSISPAARRSQI